MACVTENTEVYICSTSYMSFERNDNNKIVQSKRVLYILKLSHGQVHWQIELVTGKTIQRMKRILET